MKRTSSFSAGIALCLMVAGCGGKRTGTGDAAGDGPQQRELAALFEEERQIPRDVPDWLPIRFGPVRFLRQNRADNAYRAVMEWEQACDPMVLQHALEQKCRERFLDPTGGRVTSFELLFEHKDGDGEVRDSDKVSFDPAQASGSVHLHRLGASGSPHRVSIRLESLNWEQPETTVSFQDPPHYSAVLEGKRNAAFEGIAPLPLSLEIGRAASGSGNTELSLRWTVVKRADLQQKLAEQLDTRIDPKSRALKSLRCALIYRDRQNHPVSRDTVLLDLAEDHGSLSLRSVAGPPPASITLEPFSVTWQERRITLHWQ